MIVATWVFDENGHHEVERWQDAVAEIEGSGEFLWVSMDGTDAAELQPLADALGLHPLAVEDALSGRQRPKVDRYDSGMFVVVHPLEYDEATSSVETREMALFIGEHYVVTVRSSGYTPLRDVRYRVDQAPAALRSSPLGVLHAILDTVVDGYLVIVDELEADFEALEASIFSPTASAREELGGVSTRLYALKREARELQHAVVPLVDPVASLAGSPTSPVSKKARPFYSDVQDHLVRAAARAGTLERSLTDVFNVHLAQVSAQQNVDSRRISAWAAIIVVPTVIAGIYGMNFRYMPELGLRWGYPAALGAMVVACAALYRTFKRSGWL